MKQFKILLLPIALLIMSVVGCSKNEFTNTNPNNITASTVDYRSVLPAQQQRLVSTTASDYRFLQYWMGFWARSGSFQSITDEEIYDFQNTFNVQLWNNNYSIATNFDFVINKAKADNEAKYESIARIMKAQNIQTLVDIYGNIPYKQAFKGNDNRTPAYDNGRDIYVDLLRQLDTAITLMKSPAAANILANVGIETNDIVFQGNSTKWIKYANTLKLRLLIHVFAVPGFDIAGEMTKITTEGTGFMDDASEPAVNPGYIAIKPNPFYRTYVITEAGSLAGSGNLSRANIYAVGTTNNGYYQARLDPRVDRFYVKPAAAVNHRGIAFGEVSGVNPGNGGSLLSLVSGPGLVPDGAASRAWLITAAESFFLQAEARQRNLLTGGTGTAASALTAGIRSSFRFLGLTQAQADAYILANAGRRDVDLAAGIAMNDPIFTILSQKWFALNAIATLEVWTDYRRTDIVYGVGIPPATNAGIFAPGPPISVNPTNTSTKIPVRLFYPQSENLYNAASLATQGTINRFTSRIFWDIN